MRGGTLTINVQTESPSLDPAAFLDLDMPTNSVRPYAIYDALVIADPKTGEVHPKVAEELSSTDALNWTLRLRANVTFSDGTPYDAEAVRINWERFADPETKSPAASAAGTIADMQVVDPLTLTITLKEPNSHFASFVAHKMAAIASPAAIDAGNLATEPVGAGPFVVKDWVKDSELVLERNPSYWNAPEPYVDTLVVRVVGDHQQRYNSFASGEADINYTTFNPSVVEAEKDGYEVVTYEPDGGRPLNFNFSKPPFDDIRVRRAVMLAISSQDFVDTVSQGVGAPFTAFFGESSPYHDPGNRYPDPDREQAQALLDEVAAETGKPVEFTISFFSVVQPHAEFLQSQLAGLENLNVTLEPLDTSTATQRLQQGDFQAIPGAVYGSPEPILYNSIVTGQGPNYWKYSNPDVDAAMNRARASVDPEVQRQAYGEVEKLLFDDAYAAWYARYYQFSILGERVRDFATFNDSVPLVNQIWVEG